MPALLFPLHACSNYARSGDDIRAALVKQDFNAALKKIEKIDRSRSELLYLYEKGLVLHYQDRWQESNATFDQAESVAEELYTKSITRELGSLVVSDQVTKYRGEAFEAVLVHYYKILNYVYLDDVDGAVVECRRVNRKLQMIMDAGESHYRNDPLVQYLTAVIYELAGEHNDASVSYRVAADGYLELGADYRIEAPLDTMPALAEGSGRVHVLLECGSVVHKDQANAVIPIFKNDQWDDNEGFAVELADRYGRVYPNTVSVRYWLRISLPKLVPMPVPFGEAVVEAIPAESPARPIASATTTVADNIDAYAEDAFNARQGRVLLRAIIRGLVKYAAKNKADSKDGGLGALVNVFNLVTESADTRSWTTLPEKILMTTMELPAGTYDLRVSLRGADAGGVSRFVIPAVEVRADRTRFINYRVY